MKIKLYLAGETHIILCDVLFVRMGDNVVSVYFCYGANIPKWIAVHDPEEKIFYDEGCRVADFESIYRIERVF